MTLSADDIKSRMERHSGIYPEELTVAALREAGCMSTVMMLPEGFNDRVRYLGNLLVQMTRDVKCDESLKYRFGALSQAMSYLLNSTSWSDGELHDFDAKELKRKLQHFS